MTEPGKPDAIAFRQIGRVAQSSSLTDRSASIAGELARLAGARASIAAEHSCCVVPPAGIMGGTTSATNGKST